MARVFIDGFERGDLRLWDSINGAAIAAARTGMSGNYCLYVGALQFVVKAFSAMSELYVAMKIYFTDVPLTNSGIIIFRSGETAVLALVAANTSANLRIQRYDGVWSDLATSTAVLSVNTTYLIESYVKIADTGGRFVIKVNGIIVIDYTGDTRPGSITTLDSIKLSSNTGQSWNFQGYYDDIVIDNANWPGASRIEGILPTANGTTNNLTPVGGVNYECVNDISDTDYIHTNTSDQLDLYTTGNLTNTIGSIKCVQVSASARKLSNANPQNLQLVTRSNNTNYVSGSKVLPSDYGVDLYNLWEVNPGTSTAWAESEVNAAEFGVKPVA